MKKNEARIYEELSRLECEFLLYKKDIWEQHNWGFVFVISYKWCIVRLPTWNIFFETRVLQLFAFL